MSASAKPVKKVPGPPPTPGPTVSRVDRNFSNDSITPPSNDPGTPIVDWTISGTCRWKIDANGRLAIAPRSGSLGELENWGYRSAPWAARAKSIRSVSFSGVVSAPTTYSMFFSCSSLASLDLTGLDTSSVECMDRMLRSCSSLTSLDLSGLDTSSVECMHEMFYDCSSLVSLDLSGLDTSNAEGMREMFHGCSNLRAVTIGPKFKFEGAFWGRQSWLPTPSGGGLTGRWISSADGIAYTPGDIPSNVAATYVAQIKDEAPKTVIAESTFAVGAATMALTECPSCGKDVSAFASSCPNCGFPVVLYASMKGRAETQGDDPLELVAANPHTPIVILEMLCGNSNWCVRAALTGNPNTPENLLFQLADDEDDDVRIALASSPYATIGVMEKLSDDADGDVIDALRQNPSTPEYIQRELERQLGNDGDRSDNDSEYDDDYDSDNDGHERSSLDLSADDLGNQYYRYGDTYLPYHDGVIEYRGKCYDVMDGGGSGETMYFDEDNGWLTELP